MKAKKKPFKYPAATSAEPSSRVKESLALPVEEIGAFAAKTHLSSILDRVAHGQKFVVTKHGKPVAQIVPAQTQKSRPVPGLWRGRIWMSDDFDAPLEDFKEYME